MFFKSPISLMFHINGLIELSCFLPRKIGQTEEERFMSTTQLLTDQ